MALELGAWGKLGTRGGTASGWGKEESHPHTGELVIPGGGAEGRVLSEASV